MARRLWQPKARARRRRGKPPTGRTRFRDAHADDLVSRAADVVRDLFKRYAAEPALLPAPWRAQAEGGGPKGARVIADYIAGMTDRYALDEHKRLFGSAGSS